MKTRNLDAKVFALLGSEVLPSGKHLVEGPAFITSSELMDRLSKLGWRIQSNGTHRLCKSPDGEGTINFSVNNWDKNWRLVASDLRRRSRPGGYADLDFVWHSPFVIPNNFNYATQSINRVYTDPKASVKILLSKLVSDLSSLEGKEIEYQDRFREIEMTDFSQDGQGIDVLFTDGTTANFRYTDNIRIR